jgi:ABC-type transport system involved in multi-copper enzyme maturation permease subunit
MTAATTALPANDFPDRISPMLVKELRQGMRTKVFVFSFILVQVLMTLIVVLGLLGSANGLGVGTANFFFWLMVAVPIVFVLPFSGLGALSGERAANTLELLFLTRLSAWRIVFGKWFAIVAQSALFLCAVLPYAVLRYFMGEVNLSVDLFILATLLLSSAVLTAITVGISPFQTRVTRVLTSLGFIFVPQIAGLMFAGPFFLGSVMVASPSSNEVWKLCLTAVVFGGLLIALMLQIAASKIAPAAENHSAAKRLIGVGFLLATVLLILVGVPAQATIVLAMICCGPLFIGAVCEPLRGNLGVYRPFVRRGFPGLLLGRFLYPGWPAGLLFAAALLGGFGLLLSAHGMLDQEREVLFFLGLVGTICFPAAIIRLFFNRFGHPLPVFIGTVAVCAVLTIVVNVIDEILNVDMRVALCVLPPSAFIQGVLSLIDSGTIFMAILLCGIGVAFSLVVLLVGGFREWKRIRVIEKQIAASADEPVA